MFAAETKLSGRSGASRSGPVRENDAKNSQLLEDAVGARKELCEQCALPAPRQSGENSGLENNLEALDPTESHPLVCQPHWTEKAQNAEALCAFSTCRMLPMGVT